VESSQNAPAGLGSQPWPAGRRRYLKRRHARDCVRCGRRCAEFPWAGCDRLETTVSLRWWVRTTRRPSATEPRCSQDSRRRRTGRALH